LQFLLALIGVATFMGGMISFEKVLCESLAKKYRKHTFLIIGMFNILIGFGMVLGRVNSIHSWYVVTQKNEN
jgi:uncharacterized membrane protein